MMDSLKLVGEIIGVIAISPTLSLISGKDGWYAVLPALGSMVVAVGFYNRRPAVTSCVNFFADGLWLVYNIIISNYSASVCGVILLLSATVGTVLRLTKKRRLKRELSEGGDTPL